MPNDLLQYNFRIMNHHFWLNIVGCKFSNAIESMNTLDVRWIMREISTLARFDIRSIIFFERNNIL